MTKNERAASLPRHSVLWSICALLALTVAVPNLVSAAAPPRGTSTASLVQRKYLRTTYDDDAGYLIGRFFKNELAPEHLVEGNASKTLCSAFIKHHSVKMDGSEEEVLRQGDAMRRVLQTYDSKLVADVDIEGFQKCCAAHPDQCPSRYIDTVIKGVVFDRSDNQWRESRREMGRPQYFSFTVADSPLLSQRTVETVSAAVITQLLSHLPSKVSSISVAIEPISSEKDDPEKASLVEWASMLMASELSENHERFVLKKVPASWKAGEENDLPPGIRLLLSLRLAKKRDELDMIWSAQFADPTHGVRFIQLKPVSIALSLVPSSLAIPSASIAPVVNSAPAVSAPPPIVPVPKAPAVSSTPQQVSPSARRVTREMPVSSLVAPTAPLKVEPSAPPPQQMPPTASADSWAATAPTELPPAPPASLALSVTANPAVVSELSLKEASMNWAGRGLFIVSLMPNSEAMRAGLQVNDYINELDGQPIRNLADLSLLLRQSPPNQPRDVKFMRGFGKKAQAIEVRLAPEVLLEAKNKMGNTALMQAALNGDVNHVQALISAHAEINAKKNNGYTALMCAAEKGHTDIVQALIEAHADLNAKTSKGYTALIFAASHGHSEVALLLIRAGANVNAKDQNDQTALDWAREKGHTKIIELFEMAGTRKPQAFHSVGFETPVSAIATPQPPVSSQATPNTASPRPIETPKPPVPQVDVNARDEKGNTALIQAASNGDLNRLQALIEAHADLNAKNNKGHTALMFAASNGNTDVLQALIRMHADLNAKNNEGHTALMFAAGNGHPEITFLLIRAGADVNAKDQNDQTALDWARKKGHTKIIGLLQKAEARK